MEVLLLKDIPNIGFAGQVKRVKNGFARNFLLPQKFAKVATTEEINSFARHRKQETIDAQLRGSRVAILAEQLKNFHLTLTKKANEQGKLYGAIGPEEIVDLLKEKGIQVNKKQIDFPKAIRSIGEYDVVVKLTSKLKPTMKVKVTAA